MRMKYRVKFKVSYCEAYFDFDDAKEACNFMTMAAKRLADGGDKTTIGLTVIKEEEEA